MKKIILIYLVLTSIGCTVHKHYHIKPQILDLPKDELFSLVVLELIKYDSKDCTGECRKTVSCTFEYFDNCLQQYAPEYFESLEIDFNEKQVFPPNVYYLDSFGRVVFSKANEKTDYYFSPMLIEKKSRSIMFQVKTKEKKKYIVVFSILNNELYLGAMSEYPYENCEW